MDIKKISAVDLKAYRQELVKIKRQKASSVNRRLQFLKRFFAWAKQVKLIRTNPAQEIRFVRRMPPTKPMALNNKGNTLSLKSSWTITAWFGKT